MEYEKIKKKKTTVLFIIDSLKVGGGAEKVLSMLTIFLSHYYNIKILVFNHFKNIYEFKGKYYYLHNKINFIPTISNSLKVYFFKDIIRIYKAITLIKPNLIISILNIPNVYTIITKFLFGIKIPLIISVRNNPNIEYKKHMQYMKTIIKILYRTKIVNKIITNSKENQIILRKYYHIPYKKLKTIYNGIDIRNINILKEQEIENFKTIFENNEFLKFINIGRLVRQKGHKYLIKAFVKVKKQIPNSKLIIIGEGPLKSYLNNLVIKNKLLNEVFFLGFKYNPFKYLKNSDIFVFSSNIVFITFSRSISPNFRSSLCII